MKPRTFVRTAGVLVLFGLTLIGCLFAYYRIPGGPSIIIAREVQYQVLDIGQGDPFRAYLEQKWGNARLFLFPMDSIPNWVYVSSDDYRECWRIPIKYMNQDTITFVATLRTRPLLLTSGYQPATLLNLHQIHGFPHTSK